jgi:UDP-N-acetylmuramyl pentapeptide phosphotransferase/UDP-N-acetylglucosamine-1-phosphate transferase
MAAGWAAAVVPVAVLAGTLALTGSVRGWLERRAILDRPVERSSHAVPVPRGGGLAVMPVLLAGGLVLVWAGPTPNGTAATLSLAALLALVSWRDDLGGLPVGLRLLAHAVAVLAGVAMLPNGAVFQGFLPPLLDRAAAALLWVWFINLFNFMDGIDGIAGVETVCLGLGIALVAALAGSGGDGTVALALATAAAGLGFLRWNWHPAQIFLGDVGSVPLGFLLGWLLLLLAAKGLWAPALILPLYYLADASLTLARRIQRGERFWQAHREHFYQRALGPDSDHAAVARLILIGDLVLMALALLALAMPVLALVLAVLACALLLLLLDRRAGYGG